MKLRTFLWPFTILLLFSGANLMAQVLAGNQQISGKPKKADYLNYVRKFADNLLEHGQDNYGPRNTPMWASVIDVENFSVPVRDVPPTKGVRPHDRALGGSNLYHDVVTMKVFDALSQVTGESKYEDAARSYTQSFLRYAQNPTTGLLGWGEHLFYNFYIDTVSISESRILDPRDYFGIPHELIAWTPPWSRMWPIDQQATQKAIEGLIYHYNGPDPKVYLFNRHAHWNKAEYQQEVMPWIKHAALYAYSFAFMYDQTNDKKWQQWSRDAGMLYWNLRDQETELVFNCYYHASETDAGKLALVGGTALYSYWLYKASELNNIPEMKEAALSMLSAYDKHGWNEEKQGYFENLNLDATIPEGTKLATPWKIGYGSSSVLVMGRVAAYLYQKEQQEFLREIAEKSARAVNSFPLPDKFTAQNIGEAINLNMDLYQITNKQQYLEKAREYAQIAIDHLWRNNFYLRQKNDRYYEAKLGIGDLAAGFMRIHLADNNQKSNQDWSF